MCDFHNLSDIRLQDLGGRWQDAGSSAWEQALDNLWKQNGDLANWEMLNEHQSKANLKNSKCDALHLDGEKYMFFFTKVIQISTKTNAIF